MFLFFQGFFLQASLILALGAQNIFVLQSGLRREHQFLVAFISSLCDTALIFLGVLGLATIFAQVPLLKITLGFLGVLFLFIYGFLKIREAKRGVKISVEKKTGSAKQIALLTLGFSLLNPHVYLDTVVLIGGYAAQLEYFSERFSFGLGAATFSTLWFFGLVLLAAKASHFLYNPKAMRVVSLVSGLILLCLAVKLGLDLWSWRHSLSR